MAKDRGIKYIFLTILLYALLIGGGLFFASIITLLVLTIADIILYPKPSRSSRMQGHLIIERVNWTFAAIVFVVSFIVVEVSILWSGSRRKKRDDDLLIELDLDASQVGDNSRAFTDEESFFTEFSIDRTKFEGKFYVQRLPRKGQDEKISIATVSFKISGCAEEFFIEQKSRESDLELLSITPLSKNNATQELDGRYKYGYSNYRFFNDFLADEEIIEDLLSNYDNFGETIGITFKNQEFIIECRKEVSSDDDLAHEDSSELLKIMYVRAQKYYRRFQALGVI